MALLAMPAPYDFELSTERMRAFGSDHVSFWEGDALHRVFDGREVRISGAPGGVEVEPVDDALRPVLLRFLGLAHDLEGFDRFARDSGDPVLERVVPGLAGFRPTVVTDPFEAIVTSITAQQVSLFAAQAIRNRLVERFGERHLRAWAFPRAERLAAAAEDELVALGFSRRKAEYVHGLAAGALDLEALAELPDEEVKARIRAVRGLGEWTADWFLARCLARPRAWPAGDLGLRRAVEAFYRDGGLMTTEEVRELGMRFAPYENLTAHHLLLARRVLP
jgi:DNA-3-methyladenine glycosylase II